MAYLIHVDAFISKFKRYDVPKTVPAESIFYGRTYF